MNRANLSSFCFRVSLEIERMRGNIFDDLRNRSPDLERSKMTARDRATYEVNDDLYRAWTALQDAQAKIAR